jgi:hypothetical protein
MKRVSNHSPDGWLVPAKSNINAPSGSFCVNNTIEKQ